MLALIDGDIVRYRTGFASNDVDERIALWRANETMEQILRAVGATEYRVYLSDSKENNFRYKLFPQYKISREKYPKPKHHEALGKFLREEWDAVTATGQEADDALGITQSSFILNDDPEYGGSGHDCIICSIDKDLLQVPGQHYNWVKNEFQEQTYIDGLRCFYGQCLTGDRTDDVSGIQGIGPKKAAKALAGTSNEREMFQVVKEMWNNDEALLLTGRLLWIRRKEEELWSFPSTTRGTDHQSQSLKQELSENVHSSGHGTLEIPQSDGAPEHGSKTEDISIPESSVPSTS